MLIKKLKLISILFFTLWLLSSCSAVGYYTQSVIGHSSIMLAREPIDEVIESAEDPLKKRLLTAVEIRQFASEKLGLPDNGSYTSYVKLKNDIPVWNVIAAEEFSLKAKQWCYLVIGCASYRGYYHKKDAENYAAMLHEQGYDVYLSGAIAYSTLGWFDDPLTSAMFRRGDASLAELIFHELAHQQLYVKGDSRFNEAFASAVGEQGAMHWLQSTNREVLLKKYKTSLSVRDDFLELLNKTKDRLTVLYGSDLPDDEKRVKKAKVFNKLREEYQQVKEQKWNGKDWYKKWFEKPINNARLVAIATYRDLVPSFVVLFERCGKNFPLFYRQVEWISNQAERNLDVACDLI